MGDRPKPMSSKKKTVDSPLSVSSDGAAVAPALEAVKKTSRRTNGKTAAATHKTAARKTSVTTTADPIVAKPPFDVETHRAAISEQAYILWLEGGSVDGRAHEDWSRAIEIVRARYENA